MNGKTGNEIDSLRQINKKKAGNTDAIVPPPTEQETQQTQIAGIGGSDALASPLPDGDDITLSQTNLKALVQAGVSQEMKGVRTQLDSIQQALEDKEKELEEERKKAAADREALEARIDSEKRQKESLAKVFGDFGYQIPGTGEDTSTVYIASSSLRGGISPTDAVREFNRILEDKISTPTSTVVNQDGEVNTHRDTRQASRFLRQHRMVLRDGMEAVARKAGLLKGTNTYSGSDAATTAANIPPAFLTYLSTLMRMEHSAQFILWQFANRRVSAGVPPGQTALVSRVRHLDSGTSSSDWELTPGVDTTDESQPLQGTGIPVKIKENGMGKNSTVRPVSIPDFIMAYSLMDLETILQTRIGYNYHLFEDICLQELWFSTTRVVYNHKGNVVESAAALSAGSGAQTTLDFLGNLRAYMSSLKITAYQDGCFGYAVPPSHIAQLTKDMKKNQQFVSTANTEELTNMLVHQTNNNDLGRVSGYVGKIAGFHIFEGNSFSTGAAGTPGVQNETINGVSTLTRTGFAFGADTIGWSTAMPMEIREDENKNFGRNRKFIWKSHEGWAALDVDPASNPPDSNDQQLRVIEVRTPMLEV